MKGIMKYFASIMYQPVSGDYSLWYYRESPKAGWFIPMYNQSLNRILQVFNMTDLSEEDKLQFVCGTLPYADDSPYRLTTNADFHYEFKLIRYGWIIL